MHRTTLCLLVALELRTNTEQSRLGVALISETSRQSDSVALRASRKREVRHNGSRTEIDAR